jgi:large subunit ribosomal protein L18
LVVTFSNTHIYAQCIDDSEGLTRVAVSTLAKDLRAKNLKTNVAGATEMGRIMGEKTKKAGISRVVFDRAGRRYHGCVKAFADAARQAGLEF